MKSTGSSSSRAEAQAHVRASALSGLAGPLTTDALLGASVSAGDATGTPVTETGQMGRSPGKTTTGMRLAAESLAWYDFGNRIVRRDPRVNMRSLCEPGDPSREVDGAPPILALNLPVFMHRTTQRRERERERVRAFFSAFFEMGAAVVPPAAVRFGAAGCFVLCRFGATVLKQTGFR